MRCKNACLIVDLREGQDMTKIIDMVSVFAAAGWHTNIALKEYGGETTKLAKQAAKEGYDLIIAHGGDGTLNAVINGVMNGKGKSIVGVLPCGTANQWAGEIGVPDDPMKAALTLVNSEARKVDLAHVAVQALYFPTSMQNGQPHTKRGKKTKVSAKTRQHFLLMAGLGIDAAMLAHTSKPLKYHLGRVAFDVAAVKELPTQQPFPIEIRSRDDASNGTVLWQGKALQVIVANTRRYANLVDIAPDAYLDDGILDVCVITAGNPISSLEQVTSLLLRRKPDTSTSEYVHGAHLSIRVPASIALQLDGSAVKLDDYLSKPDCNALKDVPDSNEILVEYHFDVEPASLPIAIPRTYDNTLFAKPKNHVQTSLPRQTDAIPQAPHDAQSAIGRTESPEVMQKLLEHGYKVKVAGVSPNPEQQNTYIIAGTTLQQDTDAIKPMAVRVNDATMVLRRTGERLSLTAAVQELQDNAEIVVEGKQSKRGVVRATRVVI